MLSRFLYDKQKQVLLPRQRESDEPSSHLPFPARILTFTLVSWLRNPADVQIKRLSGVFLVLL